MKTLRSISFLFAGLLLLTSCNKETGTSATQTSLKVSLSQNAAPYTALYLDVRGIEITGSNGSVAMLNASGGVYNVVDNDNGNDLVISSGQVNVKEIEQIKLILGTNNSLVYNNVSYPLNQPDTGNSEVHIAFHKTLVPGSPNYVLLDLDLQKSVISAGTNHFVFQPVFRALDESVLGTIRGQIFPENVTGSVKAVTKGIIYFTFISKTGVYKFKGLNPGMYTVTVLPSSIYYADTIHDVIVTAGSTTDVGLRQLKMKPCDFCPLTERF